MATWKDVAELLLSWVDSDIQKLFNKYPERNCVCTRIAPSPTWFLHFWSLFTALINRKYAKQSNGVFFLRIEDTDQKREVEWAATSLVQSLKKFWIEIDEIMVHIFNLRGEIFIRFLLSIWLKND